MTGIAVITALASYALFLFMTRRKQCTAQQTTLASTPEGTAPKGDIHQTHSQDHQAVWVVVAMHIAAIGILYRFWAILAVAVILPVLPKILRVRAMLKRRQRIYDQMDSTLANVANAVTVTGNLTNALQDVAEAEPEPMRTELLRVLHDVRLGANEDDALQQMAERSELPLFKTAVTAMIVGKRSGGQLGAILSDTAASIRELKRLEGVLKTKTAEARTQAWVMGLVPFFLCGALQLINPQWLTPLWTTPFGWVLVSIALLLEIIAIVLIRKILSVAL